MDFFLVNLQIESWAAIAPNLKSQQDWQQWLQSPELIDTPLAKQPLKQIPPLLRRRFGTLGKCALGAILQIVDEQAIPSIFASQHGDTTLTLSLLEAMGKQQDMSPTGFSLAVHNAISGLFSIARKDTSATTSIAAMEGLIMQTLFEAMGQLQDTDRVLCVIYDMPLPELYKPYSQSVPFPCAIAMILRKSDKPDGDTITVSVAEGETPHSSALSGVLDCEYFHFIELLTGMTSQITMSVNGVNWQVIRQSPI